MNRISKSSWLQSINILADVGNRWYYRQVSVSNISKKDKHNYCHMLGFCFQGWVGVCVGIIKRVIYIALPVIGHSNGLEFKLVKVVAVLCLVYIALLTGNIMYVYADKFMVVVSTVLVYMMWRNISKCIQYAHTTLGDFSNASLNHIIIRGVAGQIFSVRVA